MCWLAVLWNGNGAGPLLAGCAVARLPLPIQSRLSHYQKSGHSHESRAIEASNDFFADSL